MKASEIKFGVEIECIVPIENWGSRPIGGYHHGIQVADLPAGWKAENDCSISAGRQEVGVEIVSPVLVGPEGLQQVLDVLEWLNNLGARVNRSCGLHVTCTFPVFDIKAMKRLIHFVARHEDGIFASTGSKWRAEQCSYVRKIKDRFRPLKDMTKTSWDRNRNVAMGRYATINLTHAIAGKERVEFRAFAGTLNPAKMRGYIQLALGMVERATESKRTATWDRVSPHWIKNIKCKGKSDAHIALWHLFCELGWVHDGREYGLLERKQDMKDVRKVLFKMADKFDEQQ